MRTTDNIIIMTKLIIVIMMRNTREEVRWGKEGRGK